MLSILETAGFVVGVVLAILIIVVPFIITALVCGEHFFKEKSFSAPKAVQRVGSKIGAVLDKYVLTVEHLAHKTCPYADEKDSMKSRRERWGLD